MLLSIRALVLVGIADAWNAIDRVFILAFAAYLASTGVRAVDWARGGTGPAHARIKWGRVWIGAALVYSSVKNHAHPAPNLLKADNEGEAVGMLVAASCLVILGFWLLFSGIRSGYTNTKAARESSQVVP